MTYIQFFLIQNYFGMLGKNIEDLLGVCIDICEYIGLAWNTLECLSILSSALGLLGGILRNTLECLGIFHNTQEYLAMLECLAIPRNTKVEFRHTYKYLSILRSAWDHFRINSGMLSITAPYSCLLYTSDAADE